MNEFSRIYDLSLITSFDQREKIKASPSELEALAKRLLVVSVENFECEFIIAQEAHDGMFSVDGTFRATVTQSCGVTLAPVREIINEPVHIKIRLEENEHVDENDDYLSEEDDIEYVTHTKVDIGDLMAQYLALSLNPFPRAEGASLEDLGVTSPSGPFADLLKLKKT